MIGTTLVHYEITEKLGQGGMGSVWRAQDTKLGRDVAIKTLPPEFAQDADRLARFEREAKLLASLNHPNIAAIHGFEQDQGTHFLVMELVEGDTLSDRIKRGPIPIEEALKLALQIADALKAAHESGVIHRDLKPDNIKVSGDGNVKVLDFGLAKAMAADETDAAVSNSPTLSFAATQAGVILGTAAYMSPEQAKGRAVDRRADVWAFGCVLYEMLSGRQSFGKSDVTESLAAVISLPPEWTTLPANLHPRLRDVVERCLEKQVAKRYQDIGDVKVDIEKVLSDPLGVIGRPGAEVVQAARQSKLPLIGAAFVFGLIVAGLAAWNLKPEDPRPVNRSDYELPEGISFRNIGRNVIAVSPDGRSYVYNSTSGLYLRSRDALEARLIAGTEGDMTNPFFSPDSQWVGFFDVEAGIIEKIAISGGTPIQIGPAANNPNGISWGADDLVLLEQNDGIYRVSANGGSPELIIETEEGERFSSPQLLPDGRGILFTVGTTGGDSWDDGQIVVQSVDPPGDRKTVWNGSAARYTSTGHLIYALANDLFAIAFDLDTLETIGTAVSLEQGLARATGSDSANYGVSEDGSLVYRAGTGGGGTSSLFWVDREGNEEAIGLPLGSYYSPRLSPDGTRLAVSIQDSQNQEVWVSDLTRDPPTLTNVTNDPAADFVPIWNLDGNEIVFSSTREGSQQGLFSKRADGTGAVEPLMTVETSGNLMSYGWSPDAATLVFGYQSPDTGTDIGILSMDGDRESTPLLNSEANEATPAISPNGEWIAYASNLDGNAEVYVERYPELGDRVPISTGGGSRPLWSDDGQELFFQRTTDRATMVVPVIETDPIFRPGTARVAVEPGPGYRFGTNFMVVNYAYDSGNQRFLMIKDGETIEGASERPKIITVLNWFEELKERVPVP